MSMPTYSFVWIVTCDGQLRSIWKNFDNAVHEAIPDRSRASRIELGSNKWQFGKIKKYVVEKVKIQDSAGLPS